MVIAVELGLLYAVMALGVYLTYRVLDFPDLTVDGSFVTGAALAAVLIAGGVPPWAAALVGGLGGMVGGIVTGVLHVKANINPLLAGILTQIALYSVNLRILGKANVPVLRTRALLAPLDKAGLLHSWASIAVYAGIAIAVGSLLYWFLGTRYGVAVRATGDNELMAQSQGINTGSAKIVGLAL